MRRGLLIVVSGPAGSGKGTVNSQLVATGDFVFSVSATTRAPRPGEVNGINYHFIDREEFQRRIDENGFLEYTTYCDNFYGTPLKEAMAVLESGKNLILEIECDGAKNVKRIFPDAVLIMLIPPTFAIQEERLRGRGTETEEVIRKRLEKAKREIEQIDAYDYIVYNYNGGAAVAVDDIKAIVRAEKLAQHRQPDAVKKYFELD
ncbi:MAG: guanylate kinase [Clostridia bacterium]|nr:guanylate kinase [Clostridia bacterium]